jgi:hypothetical protein
MVRKVLIGLFLRTDMAASEFPVSEMISLAEAAGIIATLFVIFYFSRKEMRSVSIDIETKVLND